MCKRVEVFHCQDHGCIIFGGCVRHASSRGRSQKIAAEYQVLLDENARLRKRLTEIMLQNVELQRAARKRSMEKRYAKDLLSAGYSGAEALS